MATRPTVLERAPIATWFGVGGGADALCRVASVEDIAWCRGAHERVRVLGDGANLLVDDDGVEGVVLDTAGLDTLEIDGATGRVRAGAGVRLPKLIVETVRIGLGGLEVLAGIPASVGGAAVMNAGGKFGSIADRVVAVEVVRTNGDIERIERDAVAFGYRTSGLADGGSIVTAVEFGLDPGDAAPLRDRLKECMAYKKASQPMGAASAGCCFKNLTLGEAIEGVGDEGTRVSAGMLIDRAGCKGLRQGGAAVSEAHANFLVTDDGAKARDVIALMERVEARVRDTFGVTLEREVMVWTRHDGARTSAGEDCR